MSRYRFNRDPVPVPDCAGCGISLATTNAWVKDCGEDADLCLDCAEDYPPLSMAEAAWEASPGYTLVPTRVR